MIDLTLTPYLAEQIRELEFLLAGTDRTAREYIQLPPRDANLTDAVPALCWLEGAAVASGCTVLELLERHGVAA